MNRAGTALALLGAVMFGALLCMQPRSRQAAAVPPAPTAADSPARPATATDDMLDLVEPDLSLSDAEMECWEEARRASRERPQPSTEQTVERALARVKRAHLPVEDEAKLREWAALFYAMAKEMHK